MQSHPTRKLVFSIDLLAPREAQVSPRQLKQYVECLELRKEAKQVCDGLIVELLRRGVAANYTAMGGATGYWLLQVSTASLAEAASRVEPAPDNLTSEDKDDTTDSRSVNDIHIHADSADLPPLVEALNSFFSGRAVFGLVFIVVSITATALGYQMLVRRPDGAP